MLSFLAAAALAAATFYTAVLYKSPGLILLGYAQATLVVFAAVFLFFRAGRLSGSLAVPIALAQPGQPVTLQLLVENNSLLPCQRLSCRLVCSNRFLPGKKKMWVRGGTAYRGANRYECEVELEDYGLFEFRVSRMRVFDLTGFFYVNKRLNSAAMVEVLPELGEVAVRVSEGARNFFGDADVYDEERPGHDSSELFQIRPFRNGDRIQRIHWKLSAKQDELLVREDSRPKACAVIFLLNDRLPKRRGTGMGVFLQLVASISFSVMDAGCPHYVAWYSGSRQDICRRRVDDEESLYLFLDFYLRDFSGKGPADIWEEYHGKYRGENYLHRLSLEGSTLRLLQDGDELARFSGKDWSRELEKLELIL